MIFRILWSYNFIDKFFRRHKSQLDLVLILPNATTVAAAMGTVAVFYHQKAQESSDIKHFVTISVIAGSFFILLVISEHKFLLQCYRSARTPST